MNEWLKIIVPLILTALGILVFDVIADINIIKNKQSEAQQYVYRVKQLELKVQKIENLFHKEK